MIYFSGGIGTELMLHSTGRNGSLMGRNELMIYFSGGIGTELMLHSTGRNGSELMIYSSLVVLEQS